MDLRLKKYRAINHRNGLGVFSKDWIKESTREIYHRYKNEFKSSEKDAVYSATFFMDAIIGISIATNGGYKVK